MADLLTVKDGRKAGSFPDTKNKRTLGHKGKRRGRRKAKRG